MDIFRHIEDGVSESSTVEYKDKRAKNRDIAEELVALINSGGGELILGISESGGEIQQIQNVANYSEREEAINSVIEERVEPNFDFEVEVEEVDGKTLIGFSVESRGVLHSYRGDKYPIFPIRRGSITGHLHGYSILEFYRGARGEGNGDGGGEVRSLSDVKELGHFFIPAPEGHISDVCVFPDVFYPNNPVRVTARAGSTRIGRVENALAVMKDIFTFVDGEFTINQSNGAWVGRGINNFYHTLVAQDERYEEVRGEYPLDQYKTEQAVFVANLDIPYPESLMVIYIEPYVNSKSCRHFSFNFILDGYPADSQPLTEFGERTDMHIGNAHDVSIPRDGVPNPNKVPVNPIHQVGRTHSFDQEDRNWVTGLVNSNPFHEREDLLDRFLDINNVEPVSNYSKCWSHFMHHHFTEDECEYTTQRFIVTDFDKFTEAIPITLRGVHFDVDWHEVTPS